MSWVRVNRAAFIYYLKKTFTSNVEDFQVRTHKESYKQSRKCACLFFVSVCLYMCVLAAVTASVCLSTRAAEHSLPLSHRSPPQFFSQVHVHGFTQVPCTQPGYSKHSSHSGPCQPYLHLQYQHSLNREMCMQLMHQTPWKSRLYSNKSTPIHKNNY